MEINLTPFIKSACMGGAGYLWGHVTKTDPRTTAVIWLVTELVVQIFRFQFTPKKNEDNLLLVLGACGATAYMAHVKLLGELISANAALCAIANGIASTIFNGLFNNINSNVALAVTIKPLTDPTMVKLK